MHDPAPLPWMDLKSLLLAQLVNVLDAKTVASLTEPSLLRREVRLVVERLLDVADPLLNRMERELTIDQVVADALGFGPLELLFSDDRVVEICVEEPERILVRRGESFEEAGIVFRDLGQLYLITGRLLGEEGALNSVHEREVPTDFWLTAHFPPTSGEPPCLHFRRLRPAGPPVPIPAPRLPPRELAVFVRFVKACYADGLDDLLGPKKRDCGGSPNGWSRSS